ncbi:MAG: hypothetical protein IKU21_05440 [Anaerotignum sp.]|nr:hypothetical protein [Anaerotignum sp.]
MMKKFKEMIFKDFGWKLLSIAIATILWFMVINIDQPVDTRTYSRPLSIENMSVLTDKGLTIGNLEELKTTKVNVKVKAQRTALDRLSQNPEWISAVADLSELTSVNNGDIVSLPVAVSIQGGNTYGISSKSPAAVEIHIEIMDSRELPVEVKLNGTLEDGTYLSEPLLSAETVRVTGPASLVNTVVSVRASVDAEDIMANPDVTAELICYNANGVPVKGVSTDPEEIVVSYALHDMKQVPLQVEITGNPAPGYQVGEVICSPRYAALIGNTEELADLVYLQLDSINVSGRNSAVTETFRLADYLPEGMTLMGDNDGTVTVTVEITEQSQKQLTIPASHVRILGQENGKTYTLHGDAHITLTGEGTALDRVDADDLRGTIYVNNLSAGEHRVMLHAELPDGLTLNPSYITVTVRDASASTEE